MAYMSQEKKAKIVTAIKPILNRFGVKATFSVRNHSAIAVNIKAGKIDFIENFIQTDKDKPYARNMSSEQIAHIRKSQTLSVNPYWYHEHFNGKAKDFFVELFGHIKKAGDWYDRSDIMSDYFDTAFYIDVNIGAWNKPYQVVK